ncbi:hypothetical protein ACFL1I_07525 [Candidatus Omnitrophota bacterium]
MKTKVKFKIADVIIEMKSKSRFKPFTEEEAKHGEQHLSNFFYHGRQKPQISIEVKVVDKLPQINITKHIFASYHFQDRNDHWRLLKQNNNYIYQCSRGQQKQLMLVNKTLNRITAYLLPHKKEGNVWQKNDIITNFLQVFLINYFALHKNGIFVHGMAVKDLHGQSLLFAGESGCGKSTMAKLWHYNSKAMVLNDDRIVVRKHNANFYSHGLPWHGTFSAYLCSKIESAPLKKIFFIQHAPVHVVRRISQKRAFELLYPAIFPTFWDKGCLENVASFSHDLIMSVPCYILGFVNDKSVIEFVRQAAEKK